MLPQMGRRQLQALGLWQVGARTMWLARVILSGVFGQWDIGAGVVADFVAESGDLVQGIGVLLGPGTQHRESGQGPAWGRCSEDAAGVFWWEPSPQVGAMMKRLGMATCCWGGRVALRCGAAPGSSDFRQVNSCWQDKMSAMLPVLAGGSVPVGKESTRTMGPRIVRRQAALLGSGAGGG